MKYPHIVNRIFNTPLMIQPNKLDAMISGLWHRLELPGAYRYESISTNTGEKRDSAVAFADGIAHIDIFGVLAHRSKIEADSTFIIGYQTIAEQIETAIASHNVEQIVLHIDSPGGETSGAFELADRIRELDREKPISAVIDSIGTSAAFLIAAATRKVAITPSGFAGSIGVVMRHIDISSMMESDGVVVTHIFAGDHKIDGNAFEPLTNEVKGQIQTEIDSLYGMFVQRIAEFRSMPVEDVRKTQAQVFNASDSLTNKLVDVIATPDRFTSSLIRRPLFTNTAATSRNSASRRNRAGKRPPVRKVQFKNTAGESMGQRLAEYLNEQIGDGEDRDETIERMADEADIEVGTVNQILAGDINCPPLERLQGFSRALDVSEQSIVDAAGEDGCEYNAGDDNAGAESRSQRAEGAASSRARKAERKRIGAIMYSDAADGRQAQALAIALETDIDPTQATKLLEATPKEQNQPPNPLASAMAGVQNPDVGADGAVGDQDESAAEAAKIVSLIGGRK